MDKLKLVINGLVENIDVEKKTIRLNNEGEVIDIEISLEDDIKKIVCGEELKLYIKLRMNLDNDIFVEGYLEKSKMDFLAQFDCVPGVGPKCISAIYETLTEKGMSMNDICFEISVGNYSVLDGVPGVGEKVAHRIIDTLKDTITVGEISSNLVSDNKQIGGAVDTLKSLGFVQSDIDTAIGKLNIRPGMQSMDIVQMAIEVLQS